MEAIREEKLKFGACSLANTYHFRKIYCWLGDKPVCFGCAKLSKLIISNPPAPKKKRETSHKKTSALRPRILSALSDSSLSTQEIYLYLGSASIPFVSLTNLLNRMVREGIIVRDRRGKNHFNFYALPGNENLIQKRIGEPPLEEMILEALSADGALRIPEIARLLGKNRATIHNGVKRLVRRGLVEISEITITGKRGKTKSFLCSYK